MTEIDTSRLRVTLSAKTSVATLSRPAAGNAIDRALADSLLAWSHDVVKGAAVGTIRVGVLRHEGRICCAGGDLPHISRARDPRAELDYIAHTTHAAILTLNSAPVPIITVLEGVAAGGGLGIALTSDIVLATESARLKFAYTAAGITPDCGASWLLTRRMGIARAMEFALSNRTMGADEAHSAGLVSAVLADGELAERLGSLVDILATGPRGSIGQVKRLLRGAESATFAQQLEDEADTIVEALGSPDGHEGVAAFLDKRSPVFT